MSNIDNDPTEADKCVEQLELFDHDAARSLLDQLLSDSRLYTQSKDYKELLDFVVRLRNFAPFNAMLLQVQKPGLSYGASARDWRERFGRTPKEEARPLLILWPFGPVAFVYDVLDTEGKPLPEDVASFFAHGAIGDEQLVTFISLMKKKGIEWCLVDAGDRKAGSIRVIQRPSKEKERTLYRMHVNRNHSAPVQFATLTHELGHLFLGHLGPDKVLNIPQRLQLNHAQQELEAESVAYLVCARNGVTSKSQTYLANYVSNNPTIDQVDLYQVMRAAGQVETLLRLTAHTKYDTPPRITEKNIGILAYGSLIGDPGKEIKPLIVKRIATKTPFPVEFARLSRKRGNAATLVPYAIGDPVYAELLILKEDTSLGQAKDLLWRRECDEEESGKHYPAGEQPNSVRVAELENFFGFEKILYTDFLPAGKLKRVDPRQLAQCALESVAKAERGKDGISYLIQVKGSGVRTALTDQYVASILSATGTGSLADALTLLQTQRDEVIDSVSRA
jgi:hypothetical protein